MPAQFHAALFIAAGSGGGAETCGAELSSAKTFSAGSRASQTSGCSSALSYGWLVTVFPHTGIDAQLQLMYCAVHILPLFLSLISLWMHATTLAVLLINQ